MPAEVDDVRLMSKQGALQVGYSDSPLLLDGEILPWKDGAVLPFAHLQRRIGRKTLGPKILAEVPVVLIVYDLLEVDGRDVRTEPLSWRRTTLEEILNRARCAAFVLSPIVALDSWSDADAAYARALLDSAERVLAPGSHQRGAKP